MRQVPNLNSKFSYLIVGNGKLSKHFQRYFSLKQISFQLYTRSSGIPFKEVVKSADKILVLLNDDNLEKFIIETKPQISGNQILIHCSGMLSTPFAESAHPLMTFSEQLYDLSVYEKIPFITERNRKTFPELFPDLINPYYEINPDDKVLYHAYCVMSGNFTTILWDELFNFLESRNIPRSAAFEFLKMTSNNLINLKHPLTGPLKRNDRNVMQKHLQILSDKPLGKVYKAMVDAYSILKKEKEIEIDK